MPPLCCAFFGFRLHWLVVAIFAIPCGLVIAVYSSDTFSVAESVNLDFGLGHADWRAQVHCRDLVERSLEKRRLAIEVIEERLSLLDASECFAGLEEQPLSSTRGIRSALHPGASDEELFCRQVLQFVHVELMARPDADPAVEHRVEMQFQAILARQAEK